MATARRLGLDGPSVSAIALGCMAMSGTYGPVDDGESIATIHAALEAGVNLLDTGDFYGMGDNEMLIARALEGRADERPLISVKFGAQRGPDQSPLGYDARPAAVKTALAYSLRRLRREYIDIYRPARLDPNVPIEETVGAIAEMVQAGYVRFIGLSEVGAETIRRAASVHPICDVQIEYSIISRGIERSILPTCRGLGIAVTAYGVLSRGLLGGNYQLENRPAGGDIRGRFPRFAGENLVHNLALVESLTEIARAKGVTVSQLAFAWVLSRGQDVVPLLGARTRDQLRDGLGALDVTLSDDEQVAIERAVPPDAAAGTRYGEAQMVHLDSER